MTTTCVTLTAVIPQLDVFTHPKCVTITTFARLILVPRLLVLASLHLLIVTIKTSAQRTFAVHQMASVRMISSIVTITTPVLQIAAILNLDAAMMRLYVKPTNATSPHATEQKDAPKLLLFATMVIPAQLTPVTPLLDLVFTNLLYVMTTIFVRTIPVHLECVSSYPMCVTTMISAQPTRVTKLTGHVFSPQ
jgi:uncharacterized membrane protein